MKPVLRIKGNNESKKVSKELFFAFYVNAKFQETKIISTVGPLYQGSLSKDSTMENIQREKNPRKFPKANLEFPVHYLRSIYSVLGIRGSIEMV